MIKVHLSFYGNLIRYKSDRAESAREICLEQGKTVADVAVMLGMKQKEAQMILCRGKKVSWEYQLTEGDHLSLYSLSSGG